MKKGEIWLSEQPEPIGRRPVVLLSRNEAYEIRNAVTVAQITTTIRDIPVEVILDENDGVHHKCVANLDTIVTIPKSMLVKKISSLKINKIELVEKAIKFAFGMM
jgi:mRNA interferase MazF